MAATDFVRKSRYWLRVNGSLFQNVSNYFPNNSGWSQVTPEHFDSVLVKKTKSPSPFVVIIFILKTAHFGQNGSKWSENPNFQKSPRPFLNMIGHHRSNVLPFQINSSVHPTSVLGQAVCSFWRYWWGISYFWKFTKLFWDFKKIRKNQNRV